MYKSNLAYAHDPSDRFENQAANSATLEPTGVWAAVQLRYCPSTGRATVASFSDLYAADYRPFRIF